MPSVSVKSIVDMFESKLSGKEVKECDEHPPAAKVKEVEVSQDGKFHTKEDEAEAEGN